MSDFKIYPDSIISMLNENIGLFADTVLKGVVGPTGIVGVTGSTGVDGVTGPTGLTTSDKTETLTVSNNVVAGDIIYTNSDGTITKNTVPVADVFESATTTHISCCYDSTNDRIIIAYRDGGNSNFGTAVVGEVNPITNTVTYGTPVVFESASTQYTSCCYDSTSDRVVIAYSDLGNSSFGTAIIGDVNPATNAITFGTAVVFESADSDYISCCYDSTNDRVVIAYSDIGNTNFGTAIVGDVNAGTESIAFGTAVVFESATSQYVSCCYDVVADRVIIVYRDGGNTNAGTAIVGDVNPATDAITFGTAVVFQSATTIYLSCCYDSTNDRVVVAYRDSGTLNFGNAVIGNVIAASETIVFGTPVVFESAAASWIICCHDSTNDRIVIAYEDTGNSNFGTTVAGTVNPSNNSITFGTTVVFESATTTYTFCCYDSTNDRAVIVYSDGGNSSFGTSYVHPSIPSVLGIAQATILSGNSGSILVYGLDANQSGLTPGRLYYFNYFTNSLTTDSNYPLIGVAVTATSIKIKNLLPIK